MSNRTRIFKNRANETRWNAGLENLKKNLSVESAKLACFVVLVTWTSHFRYRVIPRNLHCWTNISVGIGCLNESVLFKKLIVMIFEFLAFTVLQERLIALQLILSCKTSVKSSDLQLNEPPSKLILPSLL